MLKTLSEQVQIGDADSDQYQGSTNETTQVTNNNGLITRFSRKL